VAVGTERILLLEHYGHKRRFQDKYLVKFAFAVAIALLASPHRALQVSQNFSAHDNIGISLHQYKNISCNMNRQISLFKKVI
jgi:hypothetical protein